ncbi:MAG: hypothetical protein ACJ72C_01450 [Nitrososphaeraceae archaeon]
MLVGVDLSSFSPVSSRNWPSNARRVVYYLKKKAFRDTQTGAC